MEVLTAIVGSLAAKASEYTVDPIARQVGYLFNYRSKRAKLIAQLDKLKDARENVQRRVDEAKRNGDDILDPVESWLTEVNGKISAEAAQQLVEDEEKAKKRCLFGLCPDFMSRYNFSKKAVKEANSIGELLEKEGQLGRVSCRPTPEGMPPVKGYEEFESRRGAFKGVMEALKDPNLRIIGVYGMGGVGKTTLVQQVAKKATDEKLFGYVVMAAVTQTPDKLNLQKEIVEKLDMKLVEENFSVRAGRLRKRLQEEKSNVLIILDDIWSSLDLDELGVPSGYQHMRCKILMTSREVDVLSRMNSQKGILVDTLKDDEAWKLFKKEAGDIDESSVVFPIATEVAVKCAGLPVAIAAIGRALKGKNLTHWKNTLRELKMPSIRNFKGIPPEVYKSIELSYGFLKTQELRSTFLLCSIMGHNANVEDLLRYCKGLDLIRGVETIQEAREKVSTLIDDLKASCLLLDDSTPGLFDMHDVVRDVAISIASNDHRWLALGRDDVSQDWSNEETMKNYHLISLRQYAKVSELIDLDLELKCPELTFFFMDSNEDSSLKIPKNLFTGMPKVKVLRFDRLHFAPLPSSNEFLKTLRTLCLRGCLLKDMAIIGELKNLEILDLRSSGVKMLPSEIGQLFRLKLLDLSDCYYLKVISPNVLSRLFRLEELYLYGSFDSWEAVEGGESPAGSNASLVELKNLSHLTTLEVYVRNVKAMPKDTTFFGKLDRYKISIGNQWSWGKNKLETSRMLELGDCKMFDDGLLRKVQNLCLNGLKDVLSLERINYGEVTVGSFSQLRVLKVWGCESLKNLFSFSIAREFHQLEEIEVSECVNITALIAKRRQEETLKFDKLKSLILTSLPKLDLLCDMEKNLNSSRQGRDGSNTLCLFDHQVALPMLEVLEIKGMENLERLWPNNELADEESLPKLTQLRLERCQKLLRVFPLSMSRRLQRLETLVIIDCKIVEEIFETPQSVQAQGENIITFEFSELTKLEFVDLPNLKSFYHQLYIIKLPSLKELKVSVCDKVGIPFGSSFPKIGEKNQQEISANQVPFFCLNENLEELSVGWKDAMKEICYSQQIASEHFCRLNVVRLLSFPEEMEIFPSNLFKFLTSLPNLHHLEIRYAFLKEILQEVQNELFQNLRNLEVRCCPNLKDNLISSSVSFKNLVALEVDSCGRIIKLVTRSTAKSLEQLQVMRISTCFEIEEIIEGSGDNDEDGEVKDEIRFPQLELLVLINLQKLESFCSSGDYTFQFPSLETVIVKGCPKMKMPKLHEVKFGWSDERRWFGNLNNTIQEMFNEKKYKEDEDNPSTLEQLTLRWNNEMRRIWHAYGSLQQLPPQYLCTVKVVTIESFDEEIDVFSSRQLFGFLISLPTLQRLEIFDSEFKEIFQSPLSALGDQVQDSRLESSISIERPRHDGVPQIVSFGLLTTLKVTFCNKLKYLFPSSIIKSFVQLKTLLFRGCEEMEQLIILSEGLAEEERNNIIEFPQLDYLALQGLPNLKRFCSGNQIELPSLRKLHIHNCPVLTTSNEVRENDISMENCDADVLKYLFNKGLSLTNLEELSVGWNDGMKEICHAYGPSQQLASQYSCSLKVVGLLSFHEEMEIFPSQWFQFLISLPNLQGLQIQSARVKEIFKIPSSAMEEAHVHLPKLKEALFKNLVTLEVSYCHGIKNLVTHSIAKSLVQLQEMSISWCAKIEEIIEGSGDDDDDEDGEVKDIKIHFPKLKLLELEYLQKLESFCSSGNYTFQFPSLQTVIVCGCFKMKMFSQGDPETPMLHKVKLGTYEEKERWSGSLNRTIQEMFKENVLDTAAE